MMTIRQPADSWNRQLKFLSHFFNQETARCSDESIVYLSTSKNWPIIFTMAKSCKLTQEMFNCTSFTIWHFETLQNSAKIRIKAVEYKKFAKKYSDTIKGKVFLKVKLCIVISTTFEFSAINLALNYLKIVFNVYQI